MEIASRGLFRAKWTDDIHDEWIRNLLANRSDLTVTQLDQTRRLMDTAVPDCLVTNYQSLIGSLTLPDPDDRHVLAAAIRGRCSAIITFNLKDFPESNMAEFDIEAQHPDDFLHHQFGLDEAAVVVAARQCRLRLKNPPVAAHQYLSTLASQSLPKTVAELREYETII